MGCFADARLLRGFLLVNAHLVCGQTCLGVLLDVRLLAHNVAVGSQIACALELVYPGLCRLSDCFYPLAFDQWRLTIYRADRTAQGRRPYSAELRGQSSRRGSRRRRGEGGIHFSHFLPARMRLHERLQPDISARHFSVSRWFTPPAAGAQKRQGKGGGATSC